VLDGGAFVYPGAPCGLAPLADGGAVVCRCEYGLNPFLDGDFDVVLMIFIEDISVLEKRKIYGKRLVRPPLGVPYVLLKGVRILVGYRGQNTQGPGLRDRHGNAGCAHTRWPEGSLDNGVLDAHHSGENIVKFHLSSMREGLIDRDYVRF
jgi:hypothetical protein